MPSLTVAQETFDIEGEFVIARGSRTETRVVTVRLEESGCRGWGEGVPFAHFGETPQSVAGALEEVRGDVESGLSRSELIDRMPPGAARNALDAALWDLEAKQGKAAVVAELSQQRPIRTVRTLSIASPQRMAEEARRLAGFGRLKVKLSGRGGDLDRLRAIRDAAPSCAFVVDANESWSLEQLERHLPELSSLGVELVEQPLPRALEHQMADLDSPVPLGADESFRTEQDLDRVAELYDVVNFKLDKTGGLTAALRLHARVRERGLKVMVGCMVGTSLGMAPGLVLAQKADLVDLDGPYLLREDREPGLRLEPDGWMHPNSELWG